MVHVFSVPHSMTALSSAAGEGIDPVHSNGEEDD